MAEFWDWLGRIAGLKDIDSGSASLAAGILALIAGLLAWRGIQKQIKTSERLERERIVAQEKLESDRIEHEKQVVKSAIKAELVNLAMQLVLECSFWNDAENKAPNERTRDFHTFPEPVVYRALVGRLGLIEDEATVSAIVSVYSYILYINSLSSSDIMTTRDIASQMRGGANSMHQALDDLHSGKPFGAYDVDPRTITLKNGKRADSLDQVPVSLQDYLRAVCAD